MSLRLVFSWFADAGTWPEHPGAGAAVVDAAVVGPMRLLDHVETMLGLGAPANAGVKRIAIYRRKLEACGDGRFWSESFEKDPWSTARELLKWRDELVEAGWRPETPIPGKRLVDLAAAESAGADLPRGLADRLHAAIAALAEKPNLPLSSIELVDARADLPVGWRRLLDALESCGVSVTTAAAPPNAQGSTDLARLLSPFESKGAARELAGDGSVCLLTADTELVATEAVAAWLAADKTSNDGLVFVLGNDSALLDHALRRVGLPRLGASASSPHRALLQVLPLAFALAWDPPDPKSLLDFLLLPLSPLPRWVANKLASRVAETPGVGGPLWQETFAEITKKFAEKAPEDSDAKRAATIANWRAFVEPERHDPNLGMPRAAARGIANRVAAWATARFGATDDALFLALATAANDLAEAIEATEAERFDRLLIERMIEQVIGSGVSDPTALAEAAPWRAVTHPGAIWGAADTIIWWHFADNGEIAQRAIWDSDEREALKQAGVALDDPSPALRRISSAWERPVRHARKKLILVRPSMSGGEEVKSHPLWHALVAGRPKLEKQIGARAETLLSEPAPQFAGRVLTRQEVTAGALPERRAEWSAPAGRIASRDFESASSLSSLLSCPLQWTLNYVSALEGGVRQSLAGGDALFGTLAHKIAETLFQPGAPPDPAEMTSRARSLLEELLPQMAATLLLPGAARDLATARQAIPEALAELAKFLRANKLSVVEMEKEFKDQGRLDTNTGIRGFIDLLAREENGREVVIDLKWQRTDKYRRKEIADGVAIQLAVYARHVGDANADVPTGYFMLRQKRFVTGAQGFNGSVVAVEGETPNETWEKIETSWRAVMTEMADGAVRAAFAQENVDQAKFNDPILMTPPKCRYCDFATLCGREA
ncbi:PD-(D/E)XK nuclease family protein [Rhodoblastus sp.]|uniref:PD-(D/E)XK nuclease family protein n=1 Tax=Rhodoblastus sp. TaxID=1962975 RepID=UPI002638B663|nr:PD-(D/E)XK nuclease family protein [Rhodoblastus sp.]